MEQHPVESTVIEAIGYSRVLEIHFESGRIYQYYDVPDDIFDAMLNAPSKGKFFNQNIRGKFRYREIEVKSRGAGSSPASAQAAPTTGETGGT
ncbi:MAG: KTSC domain-containing protein [Anaerolineae bacterium]|nr:KTSC domain-containing protein [Anaerolineae bacterium]